MKIALLALVLGLAAPQPIVMPANAIPWSARPGSQFALLEGSMQGRVRTLSGSSLRRTEKAIRSITRALITSSCWRGRSTLALASVRS